VKAVSFSTEVVETSIGGTQTVAKMKDPLQPVCHIGNEDSHCSVDSVNGRIDQSHGKVARPMTDIAEEPASDMENKENVETLASESKSAKNKPVQSVSKNGDGVFMSPVGVPAKTALLVREFEKFTPTKPKPESLRRTTQEYLDQVPGSFVTPPEHHLRRHTLETKMYETPDCYRSVQLGTPRKSLLADDSLTEVDEDGEDSCSITVAVRVRPYSQRYMCITLFLLQI
jgi:hypothetical protein